MKLLGMDPKPRRSDIRPIVIAPSNQIQITTLDTISGGDELALYAQIPTMCITHIGRNEVSAIALHNMPGLLRLGRFPQTKFNQFVAEVSKKCVQLNDSHISVMQFQKPSRGQTPNIAGIDPHASVIELTLVKSGNMAHDFITQINNCIR